MVSKLVIHIDTQHNHPCFHRNCRNYVFPQVGEWVSDVILGDREGGMRLLYHPEGESTRFCSPSLFSANNQNGKRLLCLVTFAWIRSSCHTQTKSSRIKNKISLPSFTFMVTFVRRMEPLWTVGANNDCLHWKSHHDIIWWHIRPDKQPDPDISPMMKAKDKPYFADTLPFLMLSRWFDDENF